ncbi:MAG: MFS transporter [Burkholderiales bacterium]|nr:MFS transporter [Burkholderiales bacterium]
MQPRRTSWTAVTALLAAGVVGAGAVGKLPGALPVLREDFGLSLVAAGWVVSMFNMLALASAVFFGFVADRTGALRACLLGLGALAIGATLGATTHSTITLLVSRFIEGGGFIALAVSVPALIAAAAVGGSRNVALGLWSTYMPVGFGLALLATPFVLAAMGWRWLWWGQVFAAAAVAIAIWRLRGRFPLSPPRAERTVASITEALRHPASWWCAIAMGFYALQWISVMVWLPTLLQNEHRASSLAASALTALVVAVNAPGALFGTWLMHRGLARGTLISVSAACMGICGVAIFAPALPDGWRYVACIGLSFLGGITPPAVLTSSQAYARSPAQIASLQGLIIQWSAAGQFIGPPAIAAVVSATGTWSASAYVLLTAALCGLGTGQLINRYERRLLAARAAI